MTKTSGSSPMSTPSLSKCKINLFSLCPENLHRGTALLQEASKCVLLNTGVSHGSGRFAGLLAAVHKNKHLKSVYQYNISVSS